MPQNNRHGGAEDNLAALIERFRQGENEAANELFEALYEELRRMAAVRMRGERCDHTWQPTALVNELYLALLKAKNLGHSAANQKAAFIGLAGHMMKRLLIHHSRPLHRHIEKVDVDEELQAGQGERNLLEVEDALSRLAAIQPRLRTIVEMRVFEGMEVEEIASQLGCSTRTVLRDWKFARLWLESELQPNSFNGTGRQS